MSAASLEAGFIQGGIHHAETPELPPIEIVEAGSVYRDAYGKFWKASDRESADSTKNVWIPAHPMTHAQHLYLTTMLGVASLISAAFIAALVVSLIVAAITGGAPLAVAFAAAAGVGMVIAIHRTMWIEGKLRSAFACA